MGTLPLEMRMIQLVVDFNGSEVAEMYHCYGTIFETTKQEVLKKPEQSTFLLM